jgi:hypothetical protein
LNRQHCIRQYCIPAQNQPSHHVAILHKINTPSYCNPAENPAILLQKILQSCNPAQNQHTGHCCCSHQSQPQAYPGYPQYPYPGNPQYQYPGYPQYPYPGNPQYPYPGNPNINPANSPIDQNNAGNQGNQANNAGVQTNPNLNFNASPSIKPPNIK